MLHIVRCYIVLPPVGRCVEAHAVLIAIIICTVQVYFYVHGLLISTNFTVIICIVFNVASSKTFRDFLVLVVTEGT